MRAFTGLKLASVMATVLLAAACSSTNPSTEASTGTAGVGGTSSFAPGSQGDLNASAGDSVFFDLDSSTLNAQGQSVLQAQAQWLAKYPSVTLTIEGHCDERGTREYNLALGERRAAAAKRYLISLGVDANRLQTVSYGKDRPFAVGSDDESWSQNRRDYSRVN